MGVHFFSVVQLFSLFLERCLLEDVLDEDDFAHLTMILMLHVAHYTLTHRPRIFAQRPRISLNNLTDHDCLNFFRFEKDDIS